MSPLSRALLLRGGSKKCLWTWHRGVPLQGMSVRRGQNLRYQRWSDAVSGRYRNFSGHERESDRETAGPAHFCTLPSAVGVPGGPLWGHRHGGPSVDGPLPAAPGVWRFWNCRVPGPQTDGGQLERCRLPHKRQHLADEGRKRTQVSKHVVQLRLEEMLFCLEVLTWRLQWISICWKLSDDDNSRVTFPVSAEEDTRGGVRQEHRVLIRLFMH